MNLQRRRPHPVSGRLASGRYPAMIPHQTRPPQMSSSTRIGKLATASVVILAAGALAILLYIGHAAFVPVVFSVLLALILSTPVEALNRHGLPRSLAAIFILCVILSALGLTLYMVSGPARTWIAAIPQTIRILEQKLGPLTHAVEHRLSSSAAAPTSSVAAQDVEMFISESLLLNLPSLAAALVTITILTLFLLAGGAPMAARLAGTLISAGKSTQALHVINAVRAEVGRYYVTIAMINVGLGVATAGMTMFLQLPNPLLWGTLAAVLNFVPYAGATVTLLILTIVSVVTFDNTAHIVAVVVSFLVLATIEGQLVEPLLVGRRLKLSPTVVFLALWFGGWFWGISGIVLVIPILVTLKVVAEHLPNGKILVDLLSPAQLGSIDLLSRRPRKIKSARARPP